METRGIDLAGHQARQVSVDLLLAADYVFAMSRAHVDSLVEMAHGAASRIRLLDETGDIDDPIGGDDSVYETCARRIEAALRRRLEEIPL